MLLTCCFRESKSERRARETEERVTSTLDVRQLQPQVDTVRPVDGCQVLPGVHEVHRVPPDRRDCKERAPLRKDEKRLYKQKSQESLGNKTTTASPPPYPTSSGGRQVRISSSIPYIDQSPTAPIAQAPSVTDTLKGRTEFHIIFCIFECFQGSAPQIHFAHCFYKEPNIISNRRSNFSDKIEQIVLITAYLLSITLTMKVH